MNKTLKWGLITLGLFAFLYWGIPVDIYNDFLYFITIVGAALITVTFIIFIFSFYPKRKTSTDALDQSDFTQTVEPEEKDGDNSGYVIGGLIVVMFFGMSFLVIYREMQLEKNELVKNGEVTFATVTGGSSISSRRGNLNNITLQFTNKSGKTRKVNHSISKHQFENFYVGKEVPVIYSTRYPQILQILDSKEKMKEYLPNYRPKQ